MEHQKVLNLLNEPNNSKFVKRKWNIVNDQSNANYDVRNEIIYNTEVLKSNLCDYNDAYILVRGNITITWHQVTQVAFKNHAPFTKYITKIDGTMIDDAKVLNFSNYSETAGSLWFYSKDEATHFNADITNENNVKPFEYNAKLSENTVAQDIPNQVNGKNATIAVPLKYLSNFWRSLEINRLKYGNFT